MANQTMIYAANPATTETGIEIAGLTKEVSMTNPVQPPMAKNAVRPLTEKRDSPVSVCESKAPSPSVSVSKSGPPSPAPISIRMTCTISNTVPTQAMTKYVHSSAPKSLNHSIFLSPVFIICIVFRGK